MSDESGFSQETGGAGVARNIHLLKAGFDGLASFNERREKLASALRELGEIRDDATRKSVRRLQHQLATIEPSITMIGQVKAGKTSLVNSMVGWPGLLPADVNPWTSVVTSLHVSPHPPRAPVRARFRFFDEEEWSRLLDTGGRIGELADRAGASDDLEKIRTQVEGMREKSRRRLGRRFELLMGQQHEFNAFDEEIVERYVCLGDDFGDEAQGANYQGRFADITKSADLHFQRPEYPLPLCIRDTPGVNDTFLMREQITIRAIRDSRICVVVLSAHQALSSVDMALIRLISNIKSRELVIFVNRIDELSDPGRQVPEIRESIRDTLSKHNGPADAEVIFGSAFWANHALSGTLNCLGADSAESLLIWAEAVLTPAQGRPQDESPLQLVWQLSGLPALFATLSERIATGAGHEAVERIARSANNLATGLKASGHFASAGPRLTHGLEMERAALESELDRIETRCTEMLKQSFSSLLGDYFVRIDRSHRSYVERATASLVSHLEKNGENEVWTYDPSGLRLLLRSAYQVFSARANKAATEAYDTAAADLSALYARAFGAEGDFRIDAPITGHIPPPVIIGQTIALDIRGNWWRNWWQRRRGYRAFSSDFFQMIVAETEPIVQNLKETQTELARSEIFAILREFLAEQRMLLLGLSDSGDAAVEKADEMFGGGVTKERFDAISETVGNLITEAA